MSGCPSQYHEAIAEVGLPLILFQLQPALAGLNFEPDTLRAMASVEGVVAMKEASFDARRFVDTVRLLEELPRPITMLTGNDNFILESFMLGATGALIGFGAVMTGEQVDMIDAWRAGRIDDARALGRRVQRLADVVFAKPVGDYRVRLKECLVALGVLEAAHIRRPLLGISDDERAAPVGCAGRSRAARAFARMKFGVFLPSYLIPGRERTHPEDVRRFARRAEELGVDSLWITDHIVTAHRFYRVGWLDALITLSHVAAVTERVKLGTSILILPTRQPAVLAKEIATLDYLSGHRYIFGIGTGWYGPEFEACGVHKSERGVRTDEVLDATMALLSGRACSSTGGSTTSTE